MRGIHFTEAKRPGFRRAEFFTDVITAPAPGRSRNYFSGAHGLLPSSYAPPLRSGALLAPSLRIPSAPRLAFSAPSLALEARILIAVDTIPDLNVDSIDLDSASEAAQLIAARLESRDLITAFAAVDASGVVHGLALLADHDPECEVSALMALGTPGSVKLLLETITTAARIAGYGAIWLDGREADYTIGQTLCDAASALGWTAVHHRPSLAVGVSSTCWWTLDLRPTPDPTEGRSTPLDADCGV